MRKLRVLVVDDSPVFLGAVRNLLSGLPEVAHVEYASSGAAALTLAGQMKPDLVLMDIMMPGMSGIETMLALRDNEPALRMYAVSLHDAAEDRAAALKSGAAGFISKHEFATAIPDLIAALAGGNGDPHGSD